MNAKANLVATYQKLGKYTEAEKLRMEVLDGGNRVFRVEHPGTNLAKKFSKFKSRITHLFHKEEDFDNRGFAGISS